MIKYALIFSGILLTSCASNVNENFGVLIKECKIYSSGNRIIYVCDK